MKENKAVLIFDWGDTIMRDLNFPGPMKYWPHVEWVSGAETMLKGVSRKYICCIATSAAHSDTQDMIDALMRIGAEKYFKYYFSSADMGKSKPDPEFFSKIVDHLSLQPKDFISIGNVYEKDIVPAKKAGLRTIWFNEHKISGSFPMADHIIQDWKQLTGALEKHTR